ncbi:uncharacterized protein PHALS_13165 [Plasmopara halstedii]|uniref:Uncharacterized protein n=1 Tax=Plasmopara halstedii TaxID=4781 RepID=A0A0N7L605_PLAHL|nr:uncharacterized protein PHALS_13165 [Plasmopara halstedii]CEG42931.1 hypothetical protein PHALS_13165 [Plasmopara halstedii]|eukprot:XP_024579300.1 hypothetical protein PHALS_13165 [Plasmopara halstedii]
MVAAESNSTPLGRTIKVIRGTQLKSVRWDRTSSEGGDDASFSKEHFVLEQLVEAGL